MAAPRPASPLDARLRGLAHDALARHAYSAAVFFAEQLASLECSTTADAVLLAHAHMLAGAPRRALAALEPAGGAAARDARVRGLVARCLAALHRWEDVLECLGDGTQPVDGAGPFSPGETPSDPSVDADAWCLRGRAAAALDDPAAAAAAFVAALRADPTCVDAFDELARGRLLPPGEEAALIASLRFDPADAWLADLYTARAGGGGAAADAARAAALDRLEAPAAGAAGAAANAPPSPPPATPSTTTPRRVTRAMARSGDGAAAAGAPSTGHGLAASADVVGARAAALHAAGDARGAAALAAAALSRDPAAPQPLHPYLAACVDLGRKTDLFARAHDLIAADAASADGWYAAGCYYLTASAPAAARRHFARAVRLDPRHAPAWAGLGAAAAAADESDHAVAAYRAAARRAPGAAAPLVGMAVEAGRMGHAGLADALLASAHDRAPDDPLPCHEAGAAALRRGDAATAERWLRAALDRVPSPVPAAWEPTLVALGHALRKQGRLADAEAAYEAALALAPREPGTHAALGLARHLAGDPRGAADAYHAALGLKPGDALTADLLAAALADDAAGGDDGGAPDVSLSAALAAAARGGDPALVGA